MGKATNASKPSNGANKKVVSNADLSALAALKPKKTAAVADDEDRTVGTGTVISGDEYEEDGEDDEDEDMDGIDMGEDDEDEEDEHPGEPLGFFGVVVGPGVDGAKLVCAGASRVLRLSNVALPANAPKGARASLMVRVADHKALEEDEDDDEEGDEDEEDESKLPIKELALTTLSESRPDASIDIFFQQTELVELFVIGNCDMHVTGSVSFVETPDEDEEGHGDDGPYPDFHDEDAEDDEEEGDDDDDDEHADGPMDSEEEADTYGPAAVHARDAARAKAKKGVAGRPAQRMAAKNALPSLMEELARQGDEDEADQSEYSFVIEGDDDDDDEEDDEEDDEDEDDEDMLSETTAEKVREALKGKLEVVESPKPSPKLAPKQAPKSPQQAPAQPPQSQKKRKAESDAAPAATSAATAAQTPAKKAKGENSVATPAAAKPTGTPAAAQGQFKCTACDRAFSQEMALKQHMQTKHAAGGATPAKAPASTKKK